MNDWTKYKVIDFCYVTDFVANGSFASLRENVSYNNSKDYAILVRLTDFTKKWLKGFVYISKSSYDFLKKSSLIPGDLIMSNVGEPGIVFLVPDLKQPMTLGPNSILIRPNEKFSTSKFLYLYFLSKKGKKQIDDISSGAAQKKFNKTSFRDLEICLPPLPEQKRIISILDEVFADIDIANANAKQNLKNAKELFESYLKEVFEKKNENWVNSTIGETCNLQTGGTPSTSKKEYYQDGTIKWLVSGDINQRVISNCEGRITELGMNNSNTKYLPINSVLIALNGQGKTRGTVAMLRTKATCNQSLVSIYPKDEKKLLPELVFSNLEGRYEEIRKMTGDSGNDRRGLNMPLIRSIRFSYPKNLTEQREIIKKLDKIREEAKKIEAIYTQKTDSLEELKKSILQKAFSGELKSKQVKEFA